MGDNYVDRLVSPWICPVTGLEMNGRFKFILDWRTGRVLSERAYKMVKGDEAEKIMEEDVVILNPNEGEEADRMRTKMEGRKAREKAAKKAKKEGSGASKRKGEEEVEPKDANGVVKKSKVFVSASTSSSEAKKEKKPKSIQEDNTKSEVYKSLFSSHASAQNRPKGNWVTFDPRYN